MQLSHPLNLTADCRRFELSAGIKVESLDDVFSGKLARRAMVFSCVRRKRSTPDGAADGMTSSSRLAHIFQHRFVVLMMPAGKRVKQFKAEPWRRHDFSSTHRIDIFGDARLPRRRFAKLHYGLAKALDLALRSCR